MAGKTEPGLASQPGDGGGQGRPRKPSAGEGRALEPPVPMRDPGKGLKKPTGVEDELGLGLGRRSLGVHLVPPF